MKTKIMMLGVAFLAIGLMANAQRAGQGQGVKNGKGTENVNCAGNQGKRNPNCVADGQGKGNGQCSKFKDANKNGVCDRLEKTPQNK